MNDLLARLASCPGADARDKGCCYTVDLAADRDLRFEVIVPKQTNEWFVTGKSHGEAVWEDWAGYAADTDRGTADPQAEMHEDIERFVRRVGAVHFDLRVQGERTDLMWSPDGRWQPFTLQSFLHPAP